MSRRRRPGPPAKLAAARPIRCFAACEPENPRDSPRSKPRLELQQSDKVRVMRTCKTAGSAPLTEGGLRGLVAYKVEDLHHSEVQVLPRAATENMLESSAESPGFCSSI